MRAAGFVVLAASTLLLSCATFGIFGSNEYGLARAQTEEAYCPLGIDMNLILDDFDRLNPETTRHVLSPEDSALYIMGYNSHPPETTHVFDLVIYYTHPSYNDIYIFFINGDLVCMAGPIGRDVHQSGMDAIANGGVVVDPTGFDRSHPNPLYHWQRL